MTSEVKLTIFCRYGHIFGWHTWVAHADSVIGSDPELVGGARTEVPNHLGCVGHVWYACLPVLHAHFIELYSIALKYEYALRYKYDLGLVGDVWP